MENGFAVELLFDPVMEARLRDLWEVLAQAEPSPLYFRPLPFFIFLRLCLFSFRGWRGAFFASTC